ncbi:MAG: hypothetical protein CMK09_02685 [Ponticaulis sp.]|nr:hypothetical protein [Ponticaulis sp.]|tara:strand:- start:14275 stop:15663 length:1389 start_codon:yes stop_codon:yes gene_type:complete
MKYWTLAGLAALALTAHGWSEEGESEGSDPSRTELILDASGSMWGQIDGEAKITIARRVISELLETWPETSQLGMTVYGHRSEGDCQDIERLVPLGPFDAEGVRQAMSTIRPLGKTSLTDAVRQSAEALAEDEAGGSIILVTDGLETCSGDPCALGRELAERDIGLRTHIIGFGLGGEDTSALKCLAAETGGSYTDADDADDLQDALQTAGEQASQEPLGLLQVVTLRAEDANGTLLPNEPGVLWSIQKDGEDAPAGSAAAGSLYDARLAPGLYSITGQHGEDIRVTQSVEVTDEATQTVTFVFADGSVRAVPVLVPGGEPLSGIFTWVMYDASGETDGAQVARDAGRNGRFTLPVGTYRLRFSSEDLTVDQEVTIVADETLETEMVLNAGWIEANGVRGTSWVLYRLDEDGTRARAASEVRASTRFLVSAGQYQLEAQGPDGTDVRDVSLSAGRTVSVTLE